MADESPNGVAETIVADPDDTTIPAPPKLPEPLILRGPVAYLMVEPMGDGRYLLTTTPGRLIIGRKEIQVVVNGLIALL